MIFFLGLVLVSIASGFLLHSIPACFLIMGIGFMVISLHNYLGGRGPL